MTKNYQLTASLFIASVFVAASVSAQSIAVGGTGTMSRVSIERSEFADGKILQRERIAGIIRTDDENSPMHLNTEDCLLTTVHAADDTLLEGIGRKRYMRSGRRRP